MMYSFESNRIVTWVNRSGPTTLPRISSAFLDSQFTGRCLFLFQPAFSTAIPSLPSCQLIQPQQRAPKQLPRGTTATAQHNRCPPLQGRHNPGCRQPRTECRQLVLTRRKVSKYTAEQQTLIRHLMTSVSGTFSGHQFRVRARYYKVLYLFLKNKTSYIVLYFIGGLIFF